MFNIELIKRKLARQHEEAIVFKDYITEATEEPVE